MGRDVIGRACSWPWPFGTTNDCRLWRFREKSLLREAEFGVSEGMQFDEIKAKAEAGDLPAQYNLACCYYHGADVSQDFDEAVKWFHLAAEQGNAEAQCDLGSCYHDGEGVPQDAVEAVKWWRKAAEQGHEEARRLLRDFGSGAGGDL